MSAAGRQHASGARAKAAGGAAGSVRSVSYATSPLLASPTPPWRSRLVVALVAVGFAVLFLRAVWLQILHTDFYQAEGEKRFVVTQPLPASRGRILDRHGQLLATSVAMPSVQVDTHSFAADVAQRRALAAALKMPYAELQDRLDGATGTVLLKRHATDEQWQALRALQLKGLHQVPDFQRRWPEGESAAHVVGFTQLVGQGLQGAGIDGVELAFDGRLSGRAGQRTVVRDRFGRVVEDIGEQADPRHGEDVQLAIDSKVQFFAWQRLREAVIEHRAQRGSVVVLDVKTGEVLALANYPSYDPAQRATMRRERLRNAALTDVFEPGSTMKPFIAALALERGPWRPETRIETAPGHIIVGGRRINDAHPHGVLSVAEVIQKSSNVGTVKMALPMPSREMHALYTAIGLGQRPQIDFPGAVTGRLRPYQGWREIEKATMSYGYGLSASLFQIARAYTVFASDGQLLPVSMLKREEGAAPAVAGQRQDAQGAAPAVAGQRQDAQGAAPAVAGQRQDAQGAAPAVAGQRVISPETARAVREMLRLAAGPGGTAPKAQALGYSVGGKTGTARKLEGKTYSTSKYRSFFVGLAPVSEPRIVVAVMVDEPGKGVYYGGEIAAPVFSQIVAQTLRGMNVAPDLDVKAQIATKVEPAAQESF
jgi:cell division protein FtsI (penicillin-binding protein 3)